MPEDPNDPYAKYGGKTAAEEDPYAKYNRTPIAQKQPVEMAPPEQPPKKPGFFASFAHAMGLPGSMDEVHEMQAREEALPTWQRMLPHAPGSSPSAARSIANVVAGPLVPSMVDASKTAPGSIRKAWDANNRSMERASKGDMAGSFAESMSVPAHFAAALTAPIGGGNLETAGEQLGSGDVRGGMGTTAGILAPIVAPGITRSLIGKKAPLGDTVINPRGTVPAEGASPLELQAYARQNNIPVNAAQLTEHNFPRSLMNAGERATIGGTAVRQQTKASQAALRGHVDNLMNQMSPSTPTTADAGAKLQSDIRGALEREKTIAQRNYDAIDKQARSAGVMVDTRPLKQLADSMFHDDAFMRENAKSLDPKKATAVLRDLVNFPDRATFADVQKLRSRLLTEGLKPENAINDEVQGWIKRLTGQTDQVMMDAAHTVPGLERSFRQANAHWTQLQEDFNNKRSPLAKALSEPDPVNVPFKFLQKGQAGGSPMTVSLLQRYGIDTGPLKRQLLSDLADKKFALTDERHLGGYDDDFVQALYSPQELEHIRKTGALTRSVGLNTNPSKTSEAMGSMEDLTRPPRMLPKFVAAKATNSPAFNRFLMRAPGPKPQPLDMGSVIGPAIAGAARALSPDQEMERRFMERIRRPREMAAP